MADTLNLRQKLVAAMSDIGSIGKEGFNKQSGYKFQQVADLYPKVQAAFIEHGIVFTSSQKSVEYPETHESRGGSTLFVCHVMMEFGFWDTNSDEKILVEHGGEAFDTSDKSLNKAKTAALKYCLKQMFLIGEEGEDSEAATEQAREGSKRRIKAQPDRGVELKGVELCRARGHHNTQNIIDAATNETKLACVDCGAVPKSATSTNVAEHFESGTAKSSGTASETIGPDKIAKLKELVESTKAPLLAMMKQYAKGKKYENIDGEVETDISVKEYEKLIEVLENRKRIMAGKVDAKGN